MALLIWFILSMGFILYMMMCTTRNTRAYVPVAVIGVSGYVIVCIILLVFILLSNLQPDPKKPPTSIEEKQKIEISIKSEFDHGCVDRGTYSII